MTLRRLAQNLETVSAPTSALSYKPDPDRNSWAACTLVFGLFCAVHVVVSPALAQTTISVRAQSRLALYAMRTERTLRIEGTLTGDAGEPLRDRRVELRLVVPAGRPFVGEYPVTDADGRFRASLAIASERAEIQAIFAGDADYAPVTAVTFAERTRAVSSIRLLLPAGNRLDLDIPRHRASVLLRCDAGAGGLPVALEDERGHVLGRARTDARGSAHVDLQTEAIGRASVGEIRARFDGDTRCSPAEHVLSVLWFARPRLSLRVEEATAHEGQAVSYTGVLRDRFGPLPHQDVSLVSGSRLLGTARTDARGVFASRFIPSMPAQLQLKATYEPNAPWRGFAESAVVAVRVLPNEGIPWSWLTLSAAITVLAVSFFVRRERVTPTRSDAVAPLPALVLGRTSYARERHDVGGSIRDARNGHPIAGAEAELTRGPERLPLENRAGVFLARDLPPGAWDLKCSAPGFESFSARVVVPHRGEWSAIVIHLTSLRAKAVDAFRQITPEKASPQVTVRELGATVRDPRTLPLVLQTERSAYADVPPTRADIEQIAARVHAIREKDPETSS